MDKKLSGSKKEDFLRKARERFTKAKDADNDERTAFQNDLTFFHGDQWDEDVKNTRECADPKRPCLVLNKIAEKIDQISGDFRQAKPSIKIVPVDSAGDPQLAEILAGIVRNIEYNSRAHFVYSSAFDNQVTGGRGAWRIKVETEDGKQQIRIVRLPNPLVVYWDPKSQRQDLSDSKYWFVTEWMNEDDFEEAYPDAAKLSWDATDEDRMDWQDDKNIRVAEYWYKETDKETKKEAIKFCVMSAGDILDGPHEWPGKFVPIVVALGKELWVNGKRTNRGMVRYARTPQQLYNYWSSAVTEQIALAPSAPFLVTPTHLSVSQDQWDQQAKKNYHYLIYTPDPLAPMGPQRQQPPMLSSAIANELMRMDHDIMSAMGIYKANLGDDGQEKSGRAILARQREGDVGAYGFTDLFCSALTHSGRILVDLIPMVYSQEDVLRIRGQDDKEMEVPINASVYPWQKQALKASPNYTGPVVDSKQSPYLNDLGVGTYDVQVEIGPSYSTQRQEAATMLLDIVKTVPQAGIAALDLIVKNLDLPGADELVKRLKKMIPPGIREPEPNEQPPPPQPPDPRIVIEGEKLNLEKMRLAFDMEKASRELTIKEFEAKMKSIADLVKAEAAEVGNQVASMGLMVDRMKATMQAQTQQKQLDLQQKQMDQQAQQRQSEQPQGGSVNG